MDEAEAYQLVEHLENDETPPEDVLVLTMNDPDEKADSSFEQDDGVVGFDGGEGYCVFNCGSDLKGKAYWIMIHMTSDDERPLCLTTTIGEEETQLVSDDIGGHVTGSWDSDGLQWFHHGPFELNGDSVRIHTEGFWPHVKQIVLVPSSAGADVLDYVVRNRDGGSDESSGDEEEESAGEPNPDIMEILKEPTNKSDNVVIEEDGMITVDGEEGFYEFEFINEVWAKEIYLDVTYASGDSRPMTLLVNGEEVATDCCADETGGYGVDEFQHVRCGPYPVESEVNTVKVTTNDGYFPHVGQIRVVNAKTENEAVTKLL